MKFGNRTPEDEDAILASGLFDGVWYAARYRDVAWLGMDPFVHFLQVGAAIGRSSGPSFDAARYLRENPDVATAGLNPLLHYLRRGRAEGRLAHPVDRRPVGAPVDFLEAAARRTLQGKPVGRFRNFDLELESEFLDCVEAMVALNPPGWPTGLASVVMPTRNRASLIGRAIESVLAQSHVDWELLVVDDGSSDETPEVLGRFTDDPRIRLFWLDSRGVSAARNVGLAHARGNWIFYLDSDNRWCSGFLRTMLAYLETTGRACGYSGIALEDAQEAVRGYRGEPYDWAACLESNYVDLNSFCHRRSLVDDLGDFDERLRRMVDWDLILRYGKASHPAYAPFVGCVYREDPDDHSRISVSGPLAYRSVVQAKNRTGASDPREIATAMRLDFAIRTAVPFDRRMEWGDFHFAESLKGALEVLGHTATVRFLEEDGDPAREQVSITLRGLTPSHARRGQISILWNISHPDRVDYEEYGAHELCYVASASYPALLARITGRNVAPMLQCTDTRRFWSQPDDGSLGPVLFVGNSRGEFRTIVRWAIDAGIPVEVHGTRWEGLIPPHLVSSDNIDNRQLRAHYAGATAVLNDHWDSMRDFGFVSNRVFDVLASGGRLVSDRIPLIGRMFGDAVAQVGSAPELARAVADAANGMPERDILRALSMEVGRLHSFDARAQAICNDVLELLGLPRVHDGAGAGLEHLADLPCVGLLLGGGSPAADRSSYDRILSPLTTEAAQATLRSIVLDDPGDPRVMACSACVVQAGCLTQEQARTLVDRLEAGGIPLLVDVDAGACNSDLPDAATRCLLQHASIALASTPAVLEMVRRIQGASLLAPGMRDPRLWRRYRAHGQTRAPGEELHMLFLPASPDDHLGTAMPALELLAKRHPDRFSLTVAGASSISVRAPWLRVATPAPGWADYPRLPRWLASLGSFDLGIAPSSGGREVGYFNDDRLLDYAALGLAVIAPDGHAASAGVIGVDNSPEAWLSALESVLQGEIDLRKLATAAEAHAWQERSAEGSAMLSAVTGLLQSAPL